MWRTKRITSLILVTLFITFGCIAAKTVQADTTAVPSLTISQLKVTSSNGQFVTLYNSSNSALDMSKYQLEYFNNFDISKATSSKLIDLSGTLPPHGYYMVNDGALQLCYQITVDSESLDFSSTAGLVEVLGLTQSSPGSQVLPSLQDYVGWSKTAVTGAQTLPTNVNASLLRQPVGSNGGPNVSMPGIGNWQAVQPDAANACNLVASSNTSGNQIVSNGLSQLLPANAPPATIMSDVSPTSNTASPTIPASDIGLMAPQITELLPNPNGTGNDATDEYVELYNANDTNFDLSGFVLQSGTTRSHSYTFPGATTLPAHGFVAFYSSQTKVSLSNSGGQVSLLDPMGDSINNTDPYGTAIDGQAWALASGTWYWTTYPTPGAANVIDKPAVKTTKASKAKSTRSTAAGAVKTTKSKKLKTTAAADKFADAQPQAVPIHVWVLALVGSLALLYGLYEYRRDLANYYRQCRGKFGFSRKHRQPNERRRVVDSDK